MTTSSRADADLLTADGIRLGCTAATRDEVVDQCGRLLVELGAVTPEYVTAMHEREQSMSSYLGEGFALPHGTDESRRHVNRAAVVFCQYPDGVTWEDDTETARVAIGVAAKSDEHTSVLAALARVLVDPDKAEQLRSAPDSQAVLDLLAPAIERSTS